MNKHGVMHILDGCCLVIKSSLTICNPMDCSTPGFPVLHCLLGLLKIMSIESVMPSNLLILCCPLLLLPLIFPSISGFSNESALHIRWPKYWSFSVSISTSKYSGLISFRIDWLDLRLSRVFSNTTVQKHKFFDSLLYGPVLTSVHDYQKNYSFDYMAICWQSDDVSSF